MTNEELNKHFKDLHDRFDYLAGQVESISKSDIVRKLDEAAAFLSGGLHDLATLNGVLIAIKKEVRFLNNRIDHDLELRIQRRKRDRDWKRLNKDRADMSIWEALHAGNA